MRRGSFNVYRTASAGAALLLCGEVQAASGGGPKTFTGYLIAAIVQGLIAASLVWLGLHMRRKAARARATWASVDAKILQSELVTLTVGKNSRPTWRFRYAYRFEGRDYESDQISFDARRPRSEKAITAMLGQYLAGTHVTARVNPARPSEAVLESVVGTTVLFGLAGLLLVLCVFSTLIVVRWPGS
ncbi:hypothetical protein sos41_28340 [Alphaproteobacteria bacterium SO-S41]|nr:hypothetical protein sos41_28340 [Alphaproteobacteria bacterium SO-S41]